MRIDAIEQDLPFLAARGDNTGSFLKWLDLVGVELPGCKVTDIVRWGWLAPVSRVRSPDRYFTTWTDYPSLGSKHKIPTKDVWADLLWYSGGTASGFLFRHEGLLGEWFVHPLDRLGKLQDRVYIGQKRRASVPRAGKLHPNGLKYFPWIDFFPYWKAYELIDTMESAKLFSVWLTDDVKQDLRGLQENLRRIEKYGRAWVTKEQTKWRERRQVFHYLARYRAMRAALRMAPEAFPPPRGPIDAWSVEDAAPALARRLGLSADTLEKLVAEQLLEQVHDWAGDAEKRGWPGKKAMGQLQKDVLSSIEWLHLLTGRDANFYYDRWKPLGRQPSATAGLADALPLDDRLAEDFFLDHFLSLRVHYDLVPAPGRLGESQIRKLVRTLRKRHWLFADWLLRYKLLHEGLSGPADWDWAGVAESRVIHEMTLLPLLTEKHLLDLAGGVGLTSYPSFGDLVKGAVSALEAKDKRFVGTGDYVRTNWRLTDLRAKPADPFGPIIGLDVQAAPVVANLGRAVLLFAIARDYFAHHYYQHGKVIQTKEGGFLVAGIVTSALYLSMAYL